MACCSKSMMKFIAIADAASWYCAIALIALILVASVQDSSSFGRNYQDTALSMPTATSATVSVRGNQFLKNRRPCDEIYVVGEGETLNTISDKCSDPFIVERNPHIHDPDDVFPGLVIKIIPSSPSSSSSQ